MSGEVYLYITKSSVFIFLNVGLFQHTLCMTVKVTRDRWSGKSKGFGIIQYASKSEANKALEQMHG